MHSAPAVSYPVGRSRFRDALVLLISLVSALTLLTWTWQADVVTARHLAAGVAWLASTGLAAWHGWRSPTGVLSWDGVGWNWTCANTRLAVVPEVTLDLQTGLLLRLHVGSGLAGLWVWPERRASPQRWLALRRAVFGKIPPALDLGEGVPKVQHRSDRVSA
ncbi:MAG: hypothetical protein ACOYNF_00190 [Rhodoferax sp.]